MKSQNGTIFRSFWPSWIKCHFYANWQLAFILTFGDEVPVLFTNYQSANRMNQQQE